MAKVKKEKKAVEVNEVDVIARKADVPQTLQKMQLEPGKHYKGSFWLNEYGEMMVRPEQKGTNPCGLEKLTEGDNWVIYTSKNVVRIVFSLPRLETKEVKRLFGIACSNVLARIVRYDLKE